MTDKDKLIEEGHRCGYIQDHDGRPLKLTGFQKTLAESETGRMASVSIRPAEINSGPGSKEAWNQPQNLREAQALIAVRLDRDVSEVDFFSHPDNVYVSRQDGVYKLSANSDALDHLPLHMRS